MKILSFDQATAKTGWAIIDDRKLEAYGVINLSKIEDIDERLSVMAWQMYRTVLKYEPDLVVIEDVALLRDPSALIKLARVQGGFLTLCHSDKQQYRIIKPSVWRKDLHFVQGSKVSRSQLKKQAKQYVMMNYGLKVTEDEADAICIGCASEIEYKEDFDYED